MRTRDRIFLRLSSLCLRAVCVDVFLIAGRLLMVIADAALLAGRSFHHLIAVVAGAA